MNARIIDGKVIASALRSRVAEQVTRLTQQEFRVGLAVVLIGDDPAGQIYVRNKSKAAAAAGMRHLDFHLPDTTTEIELLDLARKLNTDPQVHGILVQLPLPRKIDAQSVIETIDPSKDIDGLHSVNVGRLASGLGGLVPCMPLGCILLAKIIHPSLAGMRAVVVGRSNIVGKPVAQLLLAENATVTIAHSKSNDLPAICREADILVVAIGKPEMIKRYWIKQGSMIIDVGINRVATDDGKGRITGDVAADAAQVASAMTPVPGGVGPITIAVLLANPCAQRAVSTAYQLQKSDPFYPTSAMKKSSTRIRLMF
jgi:methylenetetrahydrofolate dehydrogenase (NADP+)/methenyltetrahydrofolate cyclohydrolase